MEIIIFLFIALSAQTQCTIFNTTFQAGEKITYSAYYNWKFIWLDAGVVIFQVDTTKYFDKKVYHLSSSGKSHSNYDFFYKIRDYFDSYVDFETLAPYKFVRDTYEGGFEVYDTYEYDYLKRKIIAKTKNSKRPYRVDSVPFKNCIIDVMAGVYYVRNLNFDSYKMDEKITLSVIIDNAVYTLYARYLGKEEVELRDKSRYRCHKLSVLLVAGTIFKSGEDMFVWVTDDENKIPVLVEAEILIGSVKAVLIDTKGLRHPQKAQLEKR